MKYIIEIKDVTKSYKDGRANAKALDQVSLQLQEGKSMVIIGPSGSGKTTLLQILGGLDLPSKGKVIINGENLLSFSDTELSNFRNKTMGFVFQFFNLHDFLTAWENVALPAMISGEKSYAEIRSRAFDLLAQVGMTERALHYPNELSGGEMQRIAIARALINEPKIIFADEPTGNLDKDNAAQVLKIFDDISNKGVSVVMITHDTSLTKRYSEIVRLDKGRIIKIKK